MIANSVLRAAGYSHFTQKVSPQLSTASLHGLQLGAVGVYETLCSRNKRQFDVRDSNGELITNYLTVQSSTANKRTMFASFLDMTKVNKICGEHGLIFRDRITFVDEWTVRLTGRVIPNGKENNGNIRNGHPVVSRYDERKKGLQARTNVWVDRFLDSGMTKAQVKTLAETSGTAKKQIEEKVKPLRKDVKAKQTSQTDLSRKVAYGGGTYEGLRTARESLREARRALIPCEESLQQQRQLSYCYNKMAKAAETCKDGQSSGPSTSTSTPSVPTWEQPAVEDFCEYLDLTQLAEGSTNNRAVVYGGTDYGVCKMSETVGMTEAELQRHINRYYQLHSDSTDNQGMDLDQSRAMKPKTITADLLNDVSHTKAMLVRRQRRLEDNVGVKQAMQDVSEASKTVNLSMTMKTIDAAQAVRRNARSTLREFEWSGTQRKAKHHQQLQTTRAISKICAEERRFVQKSYNQDQESASTQSQLDPIDGWCQECSQHHISHGPEELKYRHPQQCPKTAPHMMPVMFIGAAGTGVGSRIGGHNRRGGTKLRKEHSRYCPVAVTDEFNTSKLCVECYQRLQYAKSSRIVKGKIQTVRVKGAQECVNPDCESVRRGHTIRARDTNSAAAIAIAGASTILHPEKKRLPPFSRDLPLPTTTTTTTPH
ncbi:MAG: hypothetical protein J3Q66DRAFT_343783 [Benniella sp.]|nr:MAG: hypothetical protein J3Q66DRAFT_343783 [Benniella sp.]